LANLFAINPVIPI